MYMFDLLGFCLNTAQSPSAVCIEQVSSLPDNEKEDFKEVTLESCWQYDEAKSVELHEGGRLVVSAISKPEADQLILLWEREMKRPEVRAAAKLKAAELNQLRRAQVSASKPMTEEVVSRPRVEVKAAQFGAWQPRKAFEISAEKAHREDSRKQADLSGKQAEEKAEQERLALELREAELSRKKAEDELQEAELAREKARREEEVRESEERVMKGRDVALERAEKAKREAQELLEREAAARQASREAQERLQQQRLEEERLEEERLQEERMEQERLEREREREQREAEELARMAWLEEERLEHARRAAEEAAERLRQEEELAQRIKEEQERLEREIRETEEAAARAREEGREAALKKYREQLEEQARIEHERQLEKERQECEFKEEQERKEKQRREAEVEAERRRVEQLAQQKEQEMVQNFLKKLGFPPDDVNAFKNVHKACGLPWATKTTYPLHVAAEVGDAKLVELLLKEGADPTQKTSTGKTAAQMALKRAKGNSHSAVLKLLGEQPASGHMGGA